MNNSKTKYLVTCALFVAASFVLANIKIFGSVAFDSMPAFLGALLVSGTFGGIVASVGHLFSAILSGFPLGLPVHLITAAIMFLAAFFFSASFRFLRKKTGYVPALVVSVVVGVVLNGPVAVLALSPLLLPAMGAEALVAFTWVLGGAALANILVAHAVYPFLERAGVLKGENA